MPLALFANTRYPEDLEAFACSSIVLTHITASFHCAARFQFSVLSVATAARTSVADSPEDVGIALLEMHQGPSRSSALFYILHIHICFCPSLICTSVTLVG